MHHPIVIEPGVFYSLQNEIVAVGFPEIMVNCSQKERDYLITSR